MVICLAVHRRHSLVHVVFISEIVFDFQSMSTLMCDQHHSCTFNVDLNQVWHMRERRWSGKQEQSNSLVWDQGGDGVLRLGRN
jgi:hypothetical protein